MTSGLADPLAAARVITELESRIADLGLSLFYSENFVELSDLRHRTRDDQLTPLFDPALGAIDGFWLRLCNQDGEDVAIGAYRIDTVDTCLAEWAVGWIIGQYLKRNELIIPACLTPPKGSRTWDLKGRIVYYGELWHHSSVRKTGLLELFPRIGHFLALTKWHPDALWGLADDDMAFRGRVTRISFPRMERNFLRWDLLPEGANTHEWISIADRHDLEFLLTDELNRLRQPIRP